MLFFLFLQLAADSLRQDSASTVNYSAKKITYDLDRSVVILNDSAFISYQDIKLYSDSAYYYIDSNTLDAFGQCYLRQIDDSIRGDYLKYNLDTKKAMMNEGITQIEKGFIGGERIYWVSNKVVNVYDGKYTTCSDTPPHFYFYAPRMKAYLGDMVIARPIYLYIYDLPVLGAPFWFVPISSKRKSGLLPFRAGNSSAYGKFIRGLAYYQVINDYADMTLQVDAMEKKGIMPRLEGVWDYSPFSSGTVYGSYINETDTKKTRYSVEGRNNSPNFLLGSSFNCDVKYLSDNTYGSDFAETTIVWLEREILSQATLTRDFAGVKNTVALERRVDFVDSATYEKIPYYTVTTPSSVLLSMITYSFQGHVSYSRTTLSGYGTSVGGANIHTQPSFKQNVMGLLSISPGVDMDYAAYAEDTMGNKWPMRFGYSFGTTVNTNLYRVLDVGKFGVQGILHKVTPSVSYTYTPSFDFGRFPDVPGIPGYSRTSHIGFRLEQEFEAKAGEQNKKYNFARLELSSGYDLLDTLQPLAPVAFVLTLPLNPFPKPVTGFNTRVNGSYDTYTEDYTYTVSNTANISTDNFKMNINQTYTRGGDYQIWFNGDVKPTANWSIAYGARYDWKNRKLVDYSLTFTRNLHCWEGVFSFSQLGTDWRYDFKVRIKEIPEISIGRGLLGTLLE